jgi:hypothetical protein
MDRDAHTELHRQVGSYSLSSQWADPVKREKIIDGMRKFYDNRTEELDEMLSKRNSINATNAWANNDITSALDALARNRKTVTDRRKFQVNEVMFNRFIEIFNALPRKQHNEPGARVVQAALNTDEFFMAEYKRFNLHRLTGDKDCEYYVTHFAKLDQLCKLGGFERFEDFKNKYANNHKVVKVEVLTTRADTCDLTISSPSNSHIFALAAGIYIHNSDGRGSRVETLPGGESLGEISDLSYFQNKFLQGLRIPASYMRGGAEGGATISDGKVGIAYIEEVRFANYVSRLQSKINVTFDKHFKAYLKSAGINIDSHLFKIRLCDPQNFKDYKQAEVDEKMISNFSNVKDVPYLAARYKLIHYLGLSEDDIQENQALLKQELCIPDGGIDETLTELRMMYDGKWIEGKPDIKMPETYDDHSGGAEEEPEGDEGEEKPAEEGKAEVASSGKEKKEEPEEKAGGEEKTLADVKKAISQ